LGLRAAAAQRSTHIALGLVGLGQRRRPIPLAEIAPSIVEDARRPGAQNY
jgi:hypothetical protein